VKSETTFAHGAAWARMVRDVNVWAADCSAPTPEHCFRSKILVQGANDMELAWEQPTNSASWADGYSSEGSSFYYNFGAADGCPTLGAQGSGDQNCRPRAQSCRIVDADLICTDIIVNWKQSQVSYVAWDNPVAMPVPQIYGTNGVNANQWQRISRQHALTHDGEPIQFPAPLSQRRACLQGGSGDAPSCNTADQSWNQLFDFMWSDETTFTDELSWRWSTDMGKLWLR